MHVVMLGAEVYPFSKVGGLGDVLGALPPTLAQLGHKVQLFTPGYGCIDYRKHNISGTHIRFEVGLGDQTYPCRIAKYCHPETENYTIYFIRNETLFAERGIYSDPQGEPYADNPERFFLFQKACIRLLHTLQDQPDIIHCHDNHTGLVPALLKTLPQNVDRFADVKTIFTIHNIAYQGICSLKKKVLLGLPDYLFKPMAVLEWWGQINPLKGGIRLSDIVTTVSPAHAREITTDEQLSAGLKGVINSRPDKVKGILNGVDYTEWDPARDSHLYAAYSAADMAGKKVNKQQLLKETSLAYKLHRKPLIGMVSRLVEQKGLDLLIESLPEILKADIAMIILGSGEQKYHRALQKIASEHADHFYLEFAYNNPLAHKIYAASDLFLMPSRYEPCGISQMFALKYGAVPLAHRTGGLADTIKPWDGKQGNGFLFNSYKSAALLKELHTALGVYRQKKSWQQLQQNGMSADFSWQRSAQQYLRLYRNLQTV